MANNISATLSITLSTSGLTALQPSTPTQYFTPSTGQRAYTLSDAITSMNEQINGQTDPTSIGGDAPDVLYNFQTSSDGMIIIDAASVVVGTNLSTYDNSFTFVQGAWQ